MQPNDMLGATLPGLSPRMRAAFAAGCARRVNDILRSTGLVAPEIPRRALEVLASYAERDLFDQAEWDAVNPELGALVNQAREEFNLEVYYALRTIDQAFACAKLPDAENAAKAGYELVATASYALPDDADAAEDEEIDWIRAALDLARTSSDESIRVDMFDGLGAMPPNWLLRWEDR